MFKKIAFISSLFFISSHSFMGHNQAAYATVKRNPYEGHQQQQPASQEASSHSQIGQPKNPYQRYNAAQAGEHTKSDAPYPNRMVRKSKPLSPLMQATLKAFLKAFGITLGILTPFIIIAAIVGAFYSIMDKFSQRNAEREQMNRGRVRENNFAQ
ncbi:MAG: hypothetical protein AAF770_00740 [Bacteroidota bacterium]